MIWCMQKASKTLNKIVFWRVTPYVIISISKLDAICMLQHLSTYLPNSKTRKIMIKWLKMHWILLHTSKCQAQKLGKRSYSRLRLPFICTKKIIKKKSDVSGLFSDWLILINSRSFCYFLVCVAIEKQAGKMQWT